MNKEIWKYGIGYSVYILVIIGISQIPGPIGMISLITLLIIFFFSVITAILDFRKEKIEKEKQEGLKISKIIKDEKLKKGKEELGKKRKEEELRLLREKEQLELERKKEKERQIIEKIKAMMKVSTRIRLDMMKQTIEMDSKDFLNNIWKWADEFGFKIDGDFIIMEDADVKGFIKSLDEQFQKWGEKSNQMKRKEV